MKIFEASDINDIYVQVAREIFYTGLERNVRGLKTKEIDEEVCITLTNPENSVVTLPARHLDERVYKYLEGEFNWFKSGSLSLEPIQPYAKFWNKLANPDFTINSNYGYYTFFQSTPAGVSQFNWCVEKLKADNYTRQAIININQPMHKYFENKDFCCTIGCHFLFRKGKLDCITWMRSNDFIFGSTYNFPWFTFVHRLLAKETGLPLGNYIHIASSLHVYDLHYPMLEALANSKADPEKTEAIRKLWQDFTTDKITTFWEKAYEIHKS